MAWGEQPQPHLHSNNCTLSVFSHKQTKAIKGNLCEVKGQVQKALGSRLKEVTLHMDRG